VLKDLKRKGKGLEEKGGGGLEKAMKVLLPNKKKEILFESLPGSMTPLVSFPHPPTSLFYFLPPDTQPLPFIPSICFSSLSL